MLEAGSAVPGLFVLLKGVVEERGDDGRVFAQYAADDLFDVRGLFSGSKCSRAMRVRMNSARFCPSRWANWRLAARSAWKKRANPGFSPHNWWKQLAGNS